MVRRYALAVLVLLLAIPIHAGAQTNPAPRLSGAVIDSAGRPLAGANVALIRRATVATARGGGSLEILAQAQTDERGEFSLGAVVLRNEVSFPLESSVSLEYLVSKDGVTLRLERIAFTAPRVDAVLVSVTAELHVR